MWQSESERLNEGSSVHRRNTESGVLSESDMPREEVRKKTIREYRGIKTLCEVNLEQERS